MYTRIALGKNSAMDVVSGESSGGQGQLLILYPLLFALQSLEMYIGTPHNAMIGMSCVRGRLCALAAAKLPFTLSQCV